MMTLSYCADSILHSDLHYSSDPDTTRSLLTQPTSPTGKLHDMQRTSFRAAHQTRHTREYIALSSQECTVMFGRCVVQRNAVDFDYPSFCRLPMAYNKVTERTTSPKL
jgi:hypothetical protein